MKRLIAILFLLLPLAVFGANPAVTFKLSDFTQGPTSYRSIKLTATNAPYTAGGSSPINVTEPRQFQLNASGIVTVSNMSPLIYKVEFPADVPTTRFYITVPDTNALLNAADLASVATNQPSNVLSSHSISVADSRFVRTTNGTARELTVTSTNGAPSAGDVLTALDTTGHAYWATPTGGGGGGGLTAYDPAVFATNSSKIYVKSGSKFTNTLFYGAISLPLNQGLDTPLFTNSITIYSSGASHANSFVQNSGVFTIQNAGTAENWVSYTEASGDLGLRGVSITGTSNVFGAGDITTATLRAKSGIFGNLNPTNATSARAAIIDSGGGVSNSVTTVAELAFVSGVTAAIQTQFQGVTNLANQKVSTNNGAAYGLALRGTTTITGPEGTNGFQYGFTGTQSSLSDAYSANTLWTWDSLSMIWDFAPSVRFDTGITNVGSYWGPQVNARIAPTNATANRVLAIDANGIGTNTSLTLLQANGIVAGAASVSNDVANLKTLQQNFLPGANTTFTTNNGTNVTIASAGGGSGILTNLGTGTFTTLNSPTINNASNITTAGVSAGKLSLSSTNAAGTTNTAAIAAPNILNSNYTLTLPKDGMKGNNVSIFVVTNVSGGTNIEGFFPALSGLSFDGATLTAAGGGGGGSSGLRVTNVIASATNFLLFDLAQYDVFKVYALTNFSYMFTNQASLTNGKAYVYFQQDTNGARLLNSFGVYAGTVQTNASMQPTTNANALDVMEVLPGFFTTNLVAYWPQNFQPRVAFTNSLAGGGGGGGGGPAFGSMVGVTNAPSSSSTTQAITATNAAPQNSRVVVAVSFSKNASTLVSSITDTGGNTYVRDRATTNTDSGVRLDLWSSDMAAGALSVGNSITVTYNEGAAGGCFLSALYLTGTTGVDVSTNFFGIANGAVSCVRSTTAANVAVGFADSENVGDVYTPAWTTGSKANMGNDFEYNVYKVNASSGSLDLGGSTSTAVWFACIWVAYK